MKILVIQHKMIGDVLTSAIVFEALKTQFPNAELHYLVQKHTKAVLEGNPFIDVIIESNVTKEAYSTLKQHNYYAIIDIYSKLRSGIMAKRLGAKYRLGFSKWYSWFTYTHYCARERNKKEGIATAISDRLDILKPLIKDVNYNFKPKIYLSKQERTQMLADIQKHNISIKKPLFMINVLGSSPNKTYTFSGMAKLLDAIVSNTTDAQLLFNYIPNQLEDAKRIYEACNPETQNQITFEFYGKSLREFIVLTSYCTALIGNEGGAINMAKALNIPTFAIFSPWITTDDWAVNNTASIHENIHLKDVKPELYSKYNTKTFKAQQEALYAEFTPNLILPKLKLFLKTLI